VSPSARCATIRPVRGGPGFEARAWRLLVLTCVTGLIDAAAFLGLGQLFCAMQTGNVVFLGLGVTGAEGASLDAPLTAIGGFVAGGLVAALLLRATTVSAAVMTEIALLALATATAAAFTPEAGEAAALVTIALLAGAMGLRTTVVRRRGGGNLATTVLNLTAIGGAGGALADADDLAQRAAAFAALLLGAIAGALLLEAALWLPLAAATALTIATHVLDRREPATV
jgi:uncharacterized membrane protein YoaK (UPF0700 family)